MVKKRRVKEGRESALLARLSAIDSKLDSLQKIQEEINLKLQAENKTEKAILTEEKKLDSKLDFVKKEEQEIEKILFSIGAFSLKKKHLLELIRASAGAFLGVGLGKGLLDLTKLAETLPWLNVIGIFFFVFAISFLLIYKNKRTEVKDKGMMVVWKQLILIYFVSILIEAFAFILFGGLGKPPEIVVKTIIIGSYAAMAGAVSFSLM